MKSIPVTWVQKHGYVDNMSWVEIAPDTREVGYAIAFITVDNTAHAIVLQGMRFREIAISELVEGHRDLDEIEDS